MNDTKLTASKIGTLIASNYVLVTTNIRCWEACILDRKKTRQVVSDAGAVEGSARVYKSLFAGADDQLKRTRRAHNKVRTLINTYGFPYCKDEGAGNKKGAKLVLAKELVEIYPQDVKLRKEANEELDKFIIFYAEYRDEAIKNLALLGNIQDYPPASEVRAKFSATVTYTRLPACDFTGLMPADLAVQAGNDEAERQIESFKTSLHQMHADIREEVQGLSNIMDKCLAGKTTKVFKSKFAKLRYLAKSLSASNVTDDPAVEVIAEKLASLAEYDADTVRNSGTVQQELSDTAKDVLSTEDLDKVFDCLGGI